MCAFLKNEFKFTSKRRNKDKKFLSLVQSDCHRNYLKEMYGRNTN